MPEKKKRYLGDGVYAAFDGYHVVLTTENGISVQNEIALEPSVLQALNAYADRAFNRKPEAAGHVERNG
jgi:hypothetical protein